MGPDGTVLTNKDRHPESAIVEALNSVVLTPLLKGKKYSSINKAIEKKNLGKAWKADDTGNLVFRKTARNFNPPAAMCGKVCVVEVEEVVPAGELDPDCIHLPGVYVQRMIVGAPYDKKIEFETTRERESA